MPVGTIIYHILKFGFCKYFFKKSFSTLKMRSAARSDKWEFSVFPFEEIRSDICHMASDIALLRSDIQFTLSDIHLTASDIENVFSRQAVPSAYK